MKTHRCSVLAIYLSMLMIAGCGEKLVPFKGTVSLDGQPLAGAKVTLQRKEGPVGERVFIGKADSNGRYSTKPSWNEKSGIASGVYQVYISSVEIPVEADETTPLPDEPVPVQYRDGSQTITVPADGATDADFDLKR